MEDELRTLKEVCSSLGVKSYRLSYLLSNGLLPDVPLVGGRRLWNQKQYEELRHALELYDKSRNVSRKNVLEKGNYAQEDENE